MPALPATFNDFLGNSAAIEHLRTAIAAGRLPHSLILAGPAGADRNAAVRIPGGLEALTTTHQARARAQPAGAA